MYLKDVIGLSADITSFLKVYKLRMQTKFELNALRNQLLPAVENYNSVRDAFIKEHGTFKAVAAGSGYVLPQDKLEDLTNQEQGLKNQWQQGLKLKRLNKDQLLKELEEQEEAGDFRFLFDFIENGPPEKPVSESDPVPIDTE